MGISAVGSTAKARDTASPTAADIGQPAAQGGDQAASTLNLLISMVPTQLVGPYTFLVAIIVGIATNGAHPDQMQTLRWIVYAALCLGTVWAAIHSAKADRQTDQAKQRFPTLEVITATAAAVVWGLSIPESPLVPALHGDNRTLVPTFILIVGGVLIGFMSSALRNPRTARARTGPVAKFLQAAAKPQI